MPSASANDVPTGAVIKFSDAMILALVFPNMIGLFFLFPKVREEMKRVLGHLKCKVQLYRLLDTILVSTTGFPKTVIA